MRVAEITYSTVGNKCPRCLCGNVFVSNNPYKLGGSKMHHSCEHCHLAYEREPGFFFGAMYVSYALMAAIFITWFVSDLLWLHMSPAILTACAAGTMLALFPIVFRWSRSIWINFFVKHDPSYKSKKDHSSKMAALIPIKK